jgi:hypothetical protein
MGNASLVNCPPGATGGATLVWMLAPACSNLASRSPAP